MKKSLSVWSILQIWMVGWRFPIPVGWSHYSLLEQYLQIVFNAPCWCHNQQTMRYDETFLILKHTQNLNVWRKISHRSWVISHSVVEQCLWRCFKHYYHSNMHNHQTLLDEEHPLIFEAYSEFACLHKDFTSKLYNLSIQELNYTYEVVSSININQTCTIIKVCSTNKTLICNQTRTLNVWMRVSHRSWFFSSSIT